MYNLITCRKLADELLWRRDMEALSALLAIYE